jgi:antitoxin (DNA-binding transcriptional repressor) of toxin-antitoxin stability system
MSPRRHAFDPQKMSVLCKKEPIDLSDICVHNYRHTEMEGKIMKFLSVRDLRGKSAEVWKELPEEREMIITSNGRPIAILAAINESNLEESLSAFRQARSVEAVATLQRRSADQGTDKITMDEIDAEIKAVRNKRARVQ